MSRQPIKYRDFLYKFIEGANPKHDREMRQQASAAFSSILKWFSANSDNLYKYANQKKSEYPFPFKIPFREIDSTYQDLLLEVDRAQEGEVRTFATFEEIDEVWTFINADCNYSIALLSVNAEYAEHIVKALAAGDASRVGRLVQFSVFSYKSSFVHEFIHYLDRKRQRVDKQLSIPELYTVSNPREFNAWYQHKATVIDALLEKTLSNPGYYRDSFIKRTLLTFDNFWAWVLSVLSEGVSTGIVEHIEDPTSLSIEDLEPKWQRKLKQRFYQYYVDYIKGIASEKAANVERISTFDQLTYASVPKMYGKYVKHRGQLYVRAFYDHYDFDTANPLSIEEVARRWAVDDERPDRWGSFTVKYPLEEVWKYREYDRVPGKDSMKTDEQWAELSKSMKVWGWDEDEPALMIFGKNGVAKLGEGNHRLWIAKELEMETIPVRFAGFWQAVEPGVGRGPVI